MTIDMPLGSDSQEVEVPAWPITAGSVLPRYLSEHAGSVYRSQTWSPLPALRTFTPSIHLVEATVVFITRSRWSCIRHSDSNGS